MSVRFQTTSRRCTWLETTHRRPAIAVTTRRRSCSLREPLLANVHPRGDTATSGKWHCPKTALVYILGSTQYRTHKTLLASCHRECHNMTYQMPSQQEGYNDIPTSYHHLTYHHSKLSVKCNEPYLSPTRLSPRLSLHGQNDITTAVATRRALGATRRHQLQRYYIILTDTMLLPTFG
ncbi:hypothetical protein B0H34DRAFT_723835 [Crassisporium funariophilum]|nr:hypothetical protein B0H34DRAFT_723835 [Crassisporium funariophilum]